VLPVADPIAEGATALVRDLAREDRESRDLEFYYAEDYHQQYLYKNPGGYCPVHSTGVSCPVGTGVRQDQVPAQMDALPPH